MGLYNYTPICVTSPIDGGQSNLDHVAVVALWIGAGVYEPFSLIAGMVMDSCSAIYTWWEIWLRVLWLGVLVVSAFVPPVLIAWGRRWRWVLLSAVAGVAVSITWYVLWFVIAMVGCSL